MRNFLLSIGLLVCFTTSVVAEESKIHIIISAQIEAFQQDDIETAFTFASPKIQMLFGSPVNFGKMVQNGYPMVWRPSDVTFLRQKAVGDVVFQEMRFFDAYGRGHTFVYEMIDVSGTWKIDGVHKIKSNDVSA
jgi:hypothetical protein